ncbi:hypothetical protein Zmor_013506 [Zophobas morio]|uniref:XPG N-terminal domain-containing protein n=1 Tax=Zophobas morio TaxID=2755281 RepID=A0AA38IE50_9CUCU|nr:hypothetical protein Zmor_013506 [Zophobas morio]
MGVRGLTTFIANRSNQYLERYELHDSYLVVDGNSIACQLYKWHCRCNDCFGGDYDKYARSIYSFFRLLADCNVTPLIIFDGAYEKRKMKTVYSRMRNKVSAAKDLNSVTEGRISLFPLFLRELFVDIVMKLKLQCVRCDFEGDSDAAYLARTLQCPIVSYDSDFYIFDVLYIPFSEMDLKLRKRKGVNYIPCAVYKAERFLNSFGGLDKVNLPLLSALLGNDYIKKRAFSVFYRQLKMQKTKQNEQQTLIKSVIVWLKNETPESALRKILGRYKLKNRRRLARKIRRAIEGYSCGNTPVCSYFNIDEPRREHTTISVPEPEDIENIEDEELEESDNEPEAEGSEETTSSSSEEEDEIEVPPKCDPKPDRPDFFTDNFRRCQYPPCFMDMKVSNIYFCIPQIEDFSTGSSHFMNLKIIAAIHKILTYPNTKKLTCVSTNIHGHVKKFGVPLYENDVPKLMDVENMDPKTSKTSLLDIINVEQDIFNGFPNSWHLFLISIKYWVTNSKNKVELPCIYSLILCAIILNYVDSKVGFYRSTRSFLAKYSTNANVAKTKPSLNITQALDHIDFDNSIACMKKLIHYFQMDAKMKSYVKLFDRSIVDAFAEFQSCLLHVKYLNSLFGCPFPTTVISDFYDGTFLYNMTTNLQKRSDLKSYMKLLLESCPQILGVFEMMADEVESRIVDDLGQHEPVRKRRKKKKTVENVVQELLPCASEEDEEYIYDSNNKFSLLSFVNK